MNPADVEILATILFGIAILHTFSVKRFEMMAHRYPEGSVKENLLHVLAEVEVVFGLWAGIFMIFLLFMLGKDMTLAYLEGDLARTAAGQWLSLGGPGPDGSAVAVPEGATRFRVNFTEAAFVFAIMAMAATKPVIDLATNMIKVVARYIPLPDSLSFFFVALVLGPLLGSFITEPAAMTVTAFVLKRRYYDHGMSTKLMYATIGVLFVNVSIGGTLTHFAAPPVLMVAGKWGWGMAHMIEFYGWKSAIAVIINAVGVSAMFGREIVRMGERAPDFEETGHLPEEQATRSPWWLTTIHLLFLAAVVVLAHHMVAFLGVFLFFLGVVAVTDEYQDELKLREALLVGFFLGGLVTLGTFQKWWLQPLLSSLDSAALFLGATGLTAITDNAALTYLGSLVEGLTDASKYALVAGAVAGGGLTVIANAPNPAGYGILRPSFGKDGISPLLLLVSALAPTAVAMACLWFLPDLG